MMSTVSDNAQLQSLFETRKGQRVIIWLVDGRNTGGKVGATSASMVEILSDGGQTHYVMFDHVTNIVVGSER